MVIRICRLVVFVQLVLCATGCTQIQLRKSATQQLRTSSDIIQQQVMDNVAKISTNNEAWPEFSNINEGLTQVTDSGEGTLGLQWNARTIIQEALGLRANRAVTENWKLTPVTDPARLRAMWAVYYYTIYGTAPEVGSYSGDRQLSAIFGLDWQKLVPAPGWFCTKTERECCEKVYCGCIVGHYCDTRACVLPSHQADLQQLTYLMMHLATVTLWDGNTERAFPTGIAQLDAASVPSPTAAPSRGRAESAPAGAPPSEAAPRMGPPRQPNAPSAGPAFTPGVGNQ